MKNITRDDIAEFINIEFGLAKKDCSDLVNIFIDVIISGLKTNKFVKIHNFGTFKVKNKKARIGRNPKTKEVVMIESRNVISFIPSKNFVNLIRKLHELLNPKSLNRKFQRRGYEQWRPGGGFMFMQGGGMIPEFHTGGIIPNFGEEQLALLKGGEAVLNQKAVRGIGVSGVNAMNKGGMVPNYQFSLGGVDLPNASPATAQPPKCHGMAKVGARDGATQRRGPRVTDTTQRATLTVYALVSSSAGTQTRRRSWASMHERVKPHVLVAT